MKLILRSQSLIYLLYFENMTFVRTIRDALPLSFVRLQAPARIELRGQKLNHIFKVNERMG